MSTSTAGVVVGVFTNFITSTGIVFLNRYLYQTGFSYVTILSVFHFGITWLTTVLSCWLGFVEHKRPSSYKSIAWFAVVFALSVPFSNASLLYNSVGTYQIFKALFSPTAVFIQIIWYNTVFSQPILLSLVPICIGVVMTGISDLETSLMGVFFGVMCVLTSVLAQIWSADIQKQQELNSMQLMMYTGPLAMLILGVCVPFMDDISDGPGSLQQFDWTSDVALLVLATAACAAIVNLTLYFILKVLGAVSYQVYGHTKTCTILLGAFVLFDQQLAMLNIAGMALTMAGAFMYTYYKLQPASPAASSSSSTLSSSSSASSSTSSSSSSSIVTVASSDNFDENDFERQASLTSSKV